jgi:hypothetical protein
LCQSRHQEHSDLRLNLTRVHNTFGKKGEKIPDLRISDFEHLCTLATEGIELILPFGFTPTSVPPPLRRKYEQVSNTVHKIIASQVEDGTVLILPMAVAQHIPHIHFSCQHWTENKGKPQGRIICDVANTEDDGGMPLNGDGLLGKEIMRTRMKNRWQEIKHPTLTDLMRMVLIVVDKHG